MPQRTSSSLLESIAVRTIECDRVWRRRTTHLDPQIQLEAWDDSTGSPMTASCGAELTSLRFLHGAYNVLLMGPLGVGKRCWPTH